MYERAWRHGEMKPSYPRSPVYSELWNLLFPHQHPFPHGSFSRQRSNAASCGHVQPGYTKDDAADERSTRSIF